MAILNFGCYPQNNGSCKEPIEWIVLKFKGEEALLVSRHALDCRQIHNKSAYVSWEDFKSQDTTWENCDLRKWLNDDFLKEAFTPAEQSIIKLSKLANDDNPEYGTPGGNSTRDRVFCLSLAEAERYFKNDHERICRPTRLARKKSTDENRADSCYWWLRTPGDYAQTGSFVNPDGKPVPRGCLVTSGEPLVRPAMWVKLESAHLSLDP